MTTVDKTNLKIGAGVLAGLGILYFAFGKKTDNSGSYGGNGGNGSGTGGGYLPVVTFNATKVATALYDAMREMGTKEEAIFETLKYVSPAQFAAVYTAFGRRSYNKLSGNQYNYIPFTSLPLENLKVWLNHELSAKDYAIIRMKYPNHL